MAGMSLEDKAPAILPYKKRCDDGSKVKLKKGNAKQKPKKFNDACYCCGKPGHRKSECQKPKSEKAIRKASIMTDNNELLMVKETPIINKAIDMWFANTEALHHMSPWRVWFRNFFVINDNLIAITVGNEEIVYARDRGMIDADFDLGDYPSDRPMQTSCTYRT